MFAAKIYHIADLINLIKSTLEFDVDPYVGINDDFQVYVIPQADVGKYGSPNDNQEAAVLLSQLHRKINESEKVVLDFLVESLSNICELEAEDLVNRLSEGFTPDDALMFGPLDFDHVQAVAFSKESPSFDGALEVAGQVAGTSVSTSPLPYHAMASQCEALGTDTRKKLSNWLTHDSHLMKTDVPLPPNPGYGLSAIRKITSEDGPVSGLEMPKESWLALRLPPASPF